MPPFNQIDFLFQWSSYSNNSIVEVPLVPMTQTRIHNSGLDTLEVVIYDNDPRFNKTIPLIVIR